MVNRRGEDTMADKDPKKNGSIIDEIEGQLENILRQKRQDVEKALQEKIKREQEEAQKHLDALEQEMAKEKEALVTFQKLFAEYDQGKVELKQEIKDHLDKAVTLQAEIEKKTAETLNELKTVDELNQKLEALVKDTQGKATVMKDDLQQRYGIVATVPEATEEEEEVKTHLEKELERLNKIKELLGSGENLEISTEVEATKASFERQPAEETEGAEEEAETEAEEKVEGEEAKAEEAKAEVEEEAKEEPQEEPEEVPKNEAKADAKAEAKTDEKADEGETDAKGLKAEAGDLDILDTLEKYRQTEGEEGEGEISYFKNENNMTLDGEYIIAAVTTSVDEAKKLYVKLSQTESPKDQFFVKQDIIRHQEAVRKLMLSCIRLCEKDKNFLPEFTQDVLNMEVFKNTLEKVSMENWSNQEDFTAFDEFAKGLKENFYSKITPPAEYLHSIARELKIQTG
jgi:hypothetical protein